MLLGADTLGSAALGEFRSNSGVALVDWTAPTIVFSASVGARAGARLDVKTNYVLAYEPALGELALGEFSSVTAFDQVTTIRFVPDVLRALVGAKVDFEAADVLFVPGNIEPIARDRRPTVKVLES